MKVEVLDSKKFVVTVTGVLSPDECRELIDLTEARGYEFAPLTTAAGFVKSPEIRNNGRVMIDDPERAKRLWERVREHVPAERDGARAVGLNERFRFYRYEPGEYFKWHFDGAFERSPVERSLLTLMVYLNEDCEGGATQFYDFGDVVPRTGMALFFEHDVYHQGAPVTSGRKYVARTDVMYRDNGGR